MLCLIHVLLVSASLAIHWQLPTGNITCTCIMLTSDVCIVYLLGNKIATTTTSVSISLFFMYKIVSMCAEQWHCEQERMCVWSFALRQQNQKNTHTHQIHWPVSATYIWRNYYSANAINVGGIDQWVFQAAMTAVVHGWHIKHPLHEAEADVHLLSVCWHTRGRLYTRAFW